MGTTNFRSNGCCGSNVGFTSQRSNDNCVCKVLRQLVPQTAETCTSGCFPSGVSNEVIPFILTNTAGTLHFAFGNIGAGPGTAPGDCFVTPFFAVVSVDNNCCAVLELLQPNVDLLAGAGAICCLPINAVCDVTVLTRTGICVNVDLKCFCQVNCLDPALIANNGAARRRQLGR
ncbi:CotY/CotZ family spore coat protein [Aneurinibacillus aneurinilyticus]|uniref:Spore coat protein n=2 Tax=Aneurinibacillus aneurinilyticus TaxID=1391 RepID=A0A848CVA5_ANEAE|nr:CotY/CotZ family spore coat protein [Aneurinibacillus aneurinilyticus]ERI11647.1 hypothetical protein HMPREF0083_00254 [Aneurinibacillus aneurinilyticus ATCC 12856]MED0669057.1 CotY/CotZ family spore coat protein [Aneurinibacillus aneurinilyticus]MED0709602.1 CotY/CotZ family spore coat protein [Aneurinibacillus aneurinilyticus]MED0726367.1 CotY/CotZ family spore coat protein [Aneurinibacillus aneurinilyticus]MED0735313.1 CotY/CotZ family spore coat protein [Aneurinibacillus aneurinilyticus